MLDVLFTMNYYRHPEASYGPPSGLDTIGMITIKTMRRRRQGRINFTEATDIQQTATQALLITRSTRMGGMRGSLPAI
jgi:hypothetical protein